MKYGYGSSKKKMVMGGMKRPSKGGANGGGMGGGKGGGKGGAKGGGRKR